MELEAGLGSQRKGFNYHFVNRILSMVSVAYFDGCGCCHLFYPSKQEVKIRCVWLFFLLGRILFSLRLPYRLQLCYPAWSLFSQVKNK